MSAYCKRKTGLGEMETAYAKTEASHEQMETVSGEMETTFKSRVNSVYIQHGLVACFCFGM